jgi:hypothetical protein
MAGAAAEAAQSPKDTSSYSAAPELARIEKVTVLPTTLLTMMDARVSQDWSSAAPGRRVEFPAMPAGI